MRYHADCIVPGLYQGGMPPPGPGLASRGIDVLVLAARDNQDAAAYPGVEVVCAPGIDSTDLAQVEPSMKGWAMAARRAAAAVKAGRRVLVTCMSGWNRSGLVVGFTLRELTGWDGNRIVQRIRARRPGALSNELFAGLIADAWPDPRPPVQET